MDVTCDKCHTEYEFDDALVSEQGTSVRCTQCGHRFKVKRGDGAVPEIWIVRTVDGKTLEFRALRELKSAIGIGKIGKDDVLSRGAGRPRRLASIAELEPFFVSVTAAPPPKLAHTNIGLGALESRSRVRSHTPHGLGPTTSEPTPLPSTGLGVTEQSVAMALAARDSINVPPPSSTTGQFVRPDLGKGSPLSFGTDPSPATAFEEEKTVQRYRAVTQELRALGEELAPPSFEPATDREPHGAAIEQAPATILGVAQRVPAPTPPPRTPPPRTPAPRTPAPPVAEAPSPASAAPVPESLNKTAATFGTPREADAARSIRRTPAYGSAEVPRATDSTPESEPSTKRRREARSALAIPSPSDSSPQSARAPGSRRIKSQLEDTVAADPSAAPPPVEADNRASISSDGRGSIVTPTPAEVRYSIADTESERDLHDRRTSAASSSRRPSGAMRLFVVVLLGGAIAFGGVLLVKKFVLDAPASSDGRVAELVTAGEKAMRDGDLEEAQQKLAGAATLDEKNAHVARAQARLAAIHAELAWLELRVSPADDPGRDAVKRRFEDVGRRAVIATEHATSLVAAGEKPDVDLVTVQVDVKRIGGDLEGANKAAAALEPGAAQPEVATALGGLALADDKPDYDKAIGLLERAAAEEGGMGRARALLVYAYGRKGDAKKAREELGRLSKLAKAHPLEAELERFVERVEKGEDVALNVTDLPTLPTTATPEASGSVPEGDLSGRTAQEALQHGQIDLAESIYQKMVDRDANSVEGLTGLAAVARSRGQTKRAISIYERVAASSPSVATTIALADLKWESGDRAGGASAYRRALDLGATGSAADRARERTGGAGAQPTATTAPTSTSDATTSGAAPTSTASPYTDATTSGEAPPGPSTTSGSDVPPWEGAP